MVAIAISAPMYREGGEIILRDLSADADLSSWSRRVTRVPTLDGGAHFTDTGYSAADRTMTAVMRSDVVSDAAMDVLRVLFREYAMLTVCTQEGVFMASPESVQHVGGNVTLTLLVREQLA